MGEYNDQHGDTIYKVYITIHFYESKRYLIHMNHIKIIILQVLFNLMHWEDNQNLGILIRDQ